MTPFWLAAWAVVLSIAWLVPNHYPPWPSFHADAWSAMVFALAAGAVALRSKATVRWHAAAVLAGLLACVPMLQFGAGLIAFAGQAWISSAYLLGLLLAILTGQRWEQESSNQAAGGLFLAVGTACILSVSLQLQTWLGLIGTGIFDIWSMGLVGDRPYANIGQPNQLATLLLWGLLACAWGFVNHKMRGWVAVLMASFLLFGIALTQSRTAWLGLTLLLAASWFWRRLWPAKQVLWSVLGLFLFFWLCPFILETLSKALLIGSASYLRNDFQTENRHLAWTLFAQAALERPWFGYGWSEVGHAQLALANGLPALHMVFGHSHNLFIDLVLWLGLPAGILVSLFIVGWFGRCVLAVRSANDAILMMFLAVIGVHAMLELPLHYAYFLLPVGVVVGVLNQRLGVLPTWQTPRWTLIGLWLAASLLLAGIVRDYFRAEASIQTLRFELARIGTLPTGSPPDVVFLTQLRERIRLMRYPVKSGMDTDELAWLLAAASANPGAGVLYKAASALALNQRPEEAGQWLVKICKTSKVDECEMVKRVWAAESLSNPLMAAVPWPKQQK